MKFQKPKTGKDWGIVTVILVGIGFIVFAGIVPAFNNYGATDLSGQSKGAKDALKEFNESTQN